MKAVFQRVTRAAVTADGAPAGSIGAGALVLLGITSADTEAQAKLLASKVANLRVFCDDQDKLNLSALDVGAELLVVSNFTLCADCSHGRRPDFFGAARPEQAEPLYQRFMECLRQAGVKRIDCGVFGADMSIDMQADGPITLLLDTNDWEKK